jgi:cyclohexadieny/prephenate dehydrogenase
VSKKKFKSVLIIGVGLIGSSLARAIKEYGIFENICGLDNSPMNLEKCKELDILTTASNDLKNFSYQFDLVIIF